MDLDDVTIEPADVVPAIDLVALYVAVGWKEYLGEPDRLVRAVDQSDFVATAVVQLSEGQEQLVGLVRVVTDEVSVALIQDLLVHPAHQRRGIGRQLLDLVKARYDGVSRFVLLTDDDPELISFYEDVGFTRTGTDGSAALVTFVL